MTGSALTDRIRLGAHAALALGLPGAAQPAWRV